MLSKDFIENSEIHKIEELNKENKTRNLNNAIINIHARLRPLEKCLSEINEYITQYDSTI